VSISHRAKHCSQQPLRAVSASSIRDPDFFFSSSNQLDPTRIDYEAPSPTNLEHFSICSSPPPQIVHHDDLYLSRPTPHPRKPPFAILHDSILRITVKLHPPS